MAEYSWSQISHEKFEQEQDTWGPWKSKELEISFSVKIAEQNVR